LQFLHVSPWSELGTCAASTSNRQEAGEAVYTRRKREHSGHRAVAAPPPAAAPPQPRAPTSQANTSGGQLCWGAGAWCGDRSVDSGWVGVRCSSRRTTPGHRCATTSMTGCRSGRTFMQGLAPVRLTWGCTAPGPAGARTRTLAALSRFDFPHPPPAVSGDLRGKLHGAFGLCNKGWMIVGRTLERP
jgi:hypothetical protein